jgi:hypothetical protein
MENQHVSYILAPSGNLTVFINGIEYPVDSKDPDMGEILSILDSDTPDVSRLMRLLNIGQSIIAKLNDNIEIRDGVLYYKERPLNNSLTQRIIDFVRGDYPVKALVNFLENLMQNPSATSVNELFDFLESKGLPIDNAGYVHAYKVVRKDFYDKYSGTILNSIGAVIKKQRNEVDDVRERECSFGLHVGAMSYIKSYGNASDRVLLVRFNPRDAVSVPKDCNFTKLRVCEYEVLREIENQLEDSNYTNYAHLEDGEDDDCIDDTEGDDYKSLGYENDYDGFLCCVECGSSPDYCECDRCTLCKALLSWCECAYCDNCGELEGNCECCEDCEDCTCHDSAFLVDEDPPVRSDELVSLEKTNCFDDGYIVGFTHAKQGLPLAGGVTCPMDIAQPRYWVFGYWKGFNDMQMESNDTQTQDNCYNDGYIVGFTDARGGWSNWGEAKIPPVAEVPAFWLSGYRDGYASGESS